MAATVEDLLLAAEYVVSEGNPNVILCERGISTFETATRNTLDVNAIPHIKQNSHLPVLMDFLWRCIMIPNLHGLTDSSPLIRNSFRILCRKFVLLWSLQVRERSDLDLKALIIEALILSWIIGFLNSVFTALKSK